MASTHADKQYRTLTHEQRASMALGAKKSWANTVDRSARVAPAIAAGPQSLQWHLDRLPAKFDNATDDQRVAAAQAAKDAYFVELRLKGLETRRRKAEARRILFGNKR